MSMKWVFLKIKGENICYKIAVGSKCCVIIAGVTLIDSGFYGANAHALNSYFSKVIHFIDVDGRCCIVLHTCARIIKATVIKVEANTPLPQHSLYSTASHVEES